MLDFSNDGHEHAFRQALNKGINLFCGAGFSVAACDKSGYPLPVGGQMLEELKAEFPHDNIERYTTLALACSNLIRLDKESFNRYIGRRFRVGEYDERYASLLKVNVRRVYTTNVDDLFYRIYVDDGSANTCFVDRATRGTVPQQNKFTVQYAALHGCVRQKSDYVFGATEIASAFARSGWNGSWRELARDAAEMPMLFWGWNFADHDALAAMFAEERNLEGNVKKWVLLRNPGSEMFDYLRNLGFSIIVGDTCDMLDYLSEFERDAPGPTESAGGELEDRGGPFGRYLPPKNDASLPSPPLEEYFTSYTPQWPHVYSQSVPRLNFYFVVEDHLARGDNVIVAGIRGSGKSTLLMQLAFEFESDCPKHYMVAPTEEEMRRYIGILDGRRSLLFVDCCFSDTYAVRAALAAPNVQFVGADRDFYYDRQYFRVDKYEFSFVDITDLTKRDGQRVLDALPNELRVRGASTMCLRRDPSMVNLLSRAMSLKGTKFVDKFFEEDQEAASVFLMICYVHACGVACSFDMIFSFLNDGETTWRDMLDIVERIGNLVRSEPEIGAAYELAHGNQDYYECRSRGLAEQIIKGLDMPDPRFAEMLERFTARVPAFKICRYDLFKRSAYDSDHAKRAFWRDIDRAEEFYETCSLKDESEYVYQQAAVYCESLKEYKRAFAWIDKARNVSNYNRFSIDSTYARIYFHANVSADAGRAEEALNMLQKCCERDDRKLMHFNSYAELALEYCFVYGVAAAHPFLENAQAYVSEGLREKRASTSKTRKRLRDRQAQIERALSEWADAPEGAGA